MKKLFLFAVIFFIFNTAFGQFSVGPRVGFNLSTISGKYDSDNTIKHKWIPGFVIGAVGNYVFTDLISLNAELLYITSGGKYIYPASSKSSASSSDEISWKERYGNLQIPILAKFSFGDDFQFYGDVGPYISIILHGKYQVKSDADNFEQSGKIKFKKEPDGYTGDNLYLDPDQNRKFDFGLYLGAGVQKEIGPGVLSFDFRFGLGFLDANKFENKDDKPDGYKPYRNRNISLTFAYMFDLSK